MDFDKGKFNKFVAGIIIIGIACIGIVWYTNPELITTWLKKESLDGSVQWSASPEPKVVVKNNSDIEWTNVKVTLNKNSVSQRYEYSTPSIKKHPQGFHIPAKLFKKSNGEIYDVNAGEPHMITVDVILPEEKEGRLEIQLGGKKI